MGAFSPRPGHRLDEPSPGYPLAGLLASKSDLRFTRHSSSYLAAPHSCNPPSDLLLTRALLRGFPMLPEMVTNVRPLFRPARGQLTSLLGQGNRSREGLQRTGVSR